MIVEKKEVYPTVAGILLFGKAEVIRLQFLDGARIEYTVIEGKEWISDDEKRFTSKDITGPLILVLPKIMKLIMSDILDKFASLTEDKIRRVEIPAIPREVIREALCNAIMHRDYTECRPIQVDKFSNRIEVKNPGFSLKPEEDFDKNGSFARNTIITTVFRELLFSECKGYGIKFTQQKMRKMGFPIPLIETTRSKNLFTFTILPQLLNDQKNIEWLKRFKKFDLSDEEAKTLVILRELGGLRSTDYKALNNVDDETSISQMEKLQRLGLIEKRNNIGSVYYVPAYTLWNSLEADSKVSRNEHIALDEDSLSPKLTVIPAEVIPAISNDNLSLVAEVIKEVQKAGKRPHSEVIRSLVMKLCSIQPFTAGQLAVLLERNSRWLQREYLKEMLQANELERLYPDVPSHKKQAYFVKQKAELNKAS